jgi:surfactin synthase thioesterase subunit
VNALLPEVAVCPVVLPGHEWRLREAPYSRMERLIGPLCDALRPHARRPFALFGHSVGAIVAYEAARRLAEVAPPRCLFVSGRRAPWLPARRPPLSGLPAEELVAAVGRLGGTPGEVLEARDMMALFLPGLRADLELNETYAPLPGPALTCPVSALAGDADPETDAEEVRAWRGATSGRFQMRVFRGGHFYLSAAPSAVLAALRQDLGAQ